ncbi:hypothetical protein AB0K20_32465 [Micromonospora matsumotoense]|uniref:hypothetical protein n=1 Tax=Micromonospora matsumotoense TaxID=121616 RepID=UPI003444B6EE
MALERLDAPVVGRVGDDTTHDPDPLVSGDVGQSDWRRRARPLDQLFTVGRSAVVVEVVEPEALADRLVERLDRGGGVVTVVAELLDPQHGLPDRDPPLGRDRPASQRVAQLHAVGPTCR